MTAFTGARRHNGRRRSASLWRSHGTGWLDVSPQRVGKLVTEPDPPLDAERILRVLQEEGVDYVLIGGLAVQTHGHVRRIASVVDLFPAPDPANLERLATALRTLDARVLNPGQEDVEVDAQMLPRATIWQFATRDGGIDILHDVPGDGPTRS